MDNCTLKTEIGLPPKEKFRDVFVMLGRGDRTEEQAEKLYELLTRTEASKDALLDWCERYMPGQLKGHA